MYLVAVVGVIGFAARMAAGVDSLVSEAGPGQHTAVFAGALHMEVVAVVVVAGNALAALAGWGTVADIGVGT